MMSSNSFGIARLVIPSLCASALLASSPPVRALATITQPVGHGSLANTLAIEDAPEPIVIRATGAIETALDEYRALLGGPNNGAAVGEQPAGGNGFSIDESHGMEAERIHRVELDLGRHALLAHEHFEANRRGQRTRLVPRHELDSYHDAKSIIAA